MIRAVLDTNVSVSSILNPGGVPHRVVRFWRAGVFEICLSEPLLEELREVLVRPAIRRLARVSSAQVEELIDLVSKTAVLYRGDLEIESIVEEDPDDDVILATALATGADFIASGDRHLLKLGEYRGIPILKPRQFLEVLSEHE